MVTVPEVWFMETSVPRKTISWIAADAGAAARITTAAAMNKVITSCFFITINSVLNRLWVLPADKIRLVMDCRELIKKNAIFPLQHNQEIRGGPGQNPV
jgi:hypothetical protein